MDVVKRNNKRKFCFDYVKDVENANYVHHFKEYKEEEEQKVEYLADKLFCASMDSHFELCEMILTNLQSNEIQIKVAWRVLHMYITKKKNVHERFFSNVTISWIHQWLQAISNLEDKFLDSFTKFIDEYLTEIRHVSFEDLFPSDQARKYWCKNTTLTDNSFIKIIKQEQMEYAASDLLLEILDKNNFSIKTETYHELFNHFRKCAATKTETENDLITLLDVAKRKHIPLHFTELDVSLFIETYGQNINVIKKLNYFYSFNYIQMCNVIVPIAKTKWDLSYVQIVLSFSTSLTAKENEEILLGIAVNQLSADDDTESFELLAKTKDELKFSQPFILSIAEEIRDINTFPDCLISLISIYTHGTLIDSLKEKEMKRLLFELSFSNHKNYKKP